MLTLGALDAIAVSELKFILIAILHVNNMRQFEFLNSTNHHSNKRNVLFIDLQEFLENAAVSQIVYFQ